MSYVPDWLTEMNPRTEAAMDHAYRYGLSEAEAASAKRVRELEDLVRQFIDHGCACVCPECYEQTRLALSHTKEGENG